MITASSRWGWIIGPDHKLRALWRALLFFALGNWVLLPLADGAVGKIAAAWHLVGTEELTAGNVMLGELRLFIVTLICTALFARYEGRRIDSYGLPLRAALGGRTWEGALAGVVMAGAVAIGMYALGGMQVVGLVTTGSALAMSALGR